MNFQILFLVAAMLGMGTLFSLLAMLVGWLRWHWLIQALILVGSTAPFALIGAEDLLIVALCQGFIVLGFIRFQQSWLKMVERQNELNEVGTRRRTTIGLKEIMFGIVLVCALIATITQTLENGALHIEDFYKSAHPFRLVGIGLAFGIWNLAFVTFFRQGVSKKAKIRFSITILLLLVWAGWNDEAVLHRIKMIWYYSNASNPALTIPTKLTGLRSLVPWLILLVAGSLVTWLIAGGFRSFVYRTPRQYQNWIARLKKPAISILALAALGSMILAVITCYRSVAPTKTTSSQIYAQGAPNGFATLVEAGKQFDQSLIFNGIVPELPGPNLKDELITYEKQFTAVRHALSQPNCTWINWNTGECFSGNSSFFDPGGVELRSIARALRARNLQLLHEKRYAEAMADGVLGTRVGETLSRDPVFISTLIGTAIEGMSVDLIFSGVKKASSIQLKKIANQLDEIYSHAGSSDSEMDRILDNEKIFNRRAGWQASLIFALMSDGSTEEGIHESILRRNAYRRLLRTEIALQLYLNEHGAYPIELRLLVPDYLPEIPMDPFGHKSDRALKYFILPSGNDVRLYSLWHDRADNNGIYNEDEFMTACDFDLDLTMGDPLERAEIAVKNENDRLKAESEAEAWPDESIEDHLNRLIEDLDEEDENDSTDSSSTPLSTNK